MTAVAVIAEGSPPSLWPIDRWTHVALENVLPLLSEAITVCRRLFGA